MPLLKSNVKGVAATKPAAASSKSASGKSAAKSKSSDKPKKAEGKNQDTGPKRPPTACNAWIAKHKEKFKADNPEVKGLAIMQKMRGQWKDLDEDEKKPYEDKAKTDINEWKVEKKKWETANPDRVEEIRQDKAEKKAKREANPKASKPKAGKKSKRRSSEDDDETTEEEQPKAKKAKADPDKPKKPLASYLRFAGDKRGELKTNGVTGKEAATKLGEMWRALSDAEKAPYIAAYKAEMEVYKKKQKEYTNDSENDKGDSEDGAEAPAEEAKENGNGKSAAAANGKAESEDEAPAAAAGADGNGDANGNGDAEAADSKNDAE